MKHSTPDFSHKSQYYANSVQNSAGCHINNHILRRQKWQWECKKKKKKCNKNAACTFHYQLSTISIWNHCSEQCLCLENENFFSVVELKVTVHKIWNKNTGTTFESLF